jgi:hypothetical protein
MAYVLFPKTRYWLIGSLSIRSSSALSQSHRDLSLVPWSFKLSYKMSCSRDQTNLLCTRCRPDTIRGKLACPLTLVPRTRTTYLWNCFSFLPLRFASPQEYWIKREKKRATLSCGVVHQQEPEQTITNAWGPILDTTLFLYVGEHG